MGTVGHHRVRPIHIQTLTDQYRRLLGEIRFYQRQPFVSSSKLPELTSASHLLAQSLAMIDSDFDATTIKPISYRPPVDLPGNELTRAVLTELRVLATRVNLTTIARLIANRHNIVQSSTLVRRITKCAAALVKQGVIESDERGCILAHLATSEKERR